MAQAARGGWLALFRTLAPPHPDSDADLLARFVRERSEMAIDVLIRRHAGLVMGVCRRRFGHSTDADDAFQATFLVLARNAGRIANGASLPGWLYRVASLTCLKLAGQRHRRGDTPMESDVVDPSLPLPDASAEGREMKAILDEEIAALSEKLRAPVVLCCLEGKTNADAAALLGIPVGTVESRLCAAKEKIRTRLVKRGLAGSLLSLTVSTGIEASDDLIQRTVRSAMAYAIGSEVAGPGLTTLANEVSSTMYPLTLKTLAAAVMTLALTGGIGAGVYLAQAGDEPRKPAAASKQAEPPRDKADKKASGPSTAKALDADAVPIGATAATTAILTKSAGFDSDVEITIAEIFEQLGARFNVTFRIENVQSLRGMGIDNPYEKKIRLRFTKGLSVQDILNEVVNELTDGRSHDLALGFRVRGNQVLLSSVFVPPSSPSAFPQNNNSQEMPNVNIKVVNSILYGPTVSLSVKDKTLKEVVDLLREQTGANIVINETAYGENNRRITLSLSDTKLFTVLTVVSDMYEMAPAVVDNVFYITNPEKAKVMNENTSETLFKNLLRNDSPGGS
ncbi:MAG: sigma-70 family RNA polymerase sigma factor [Gemmataceae bacterium]